MKVWGVVVGVTIAFVTATGACGQPPARRIVMVYPPDLEAAVAAELAAEGELADITFRLAPGTYHLDAELYTDPTCGNCEDPDTPVEATVGLRIAGRNVRFEGSHADQVYVRTNAGYGLLFEDCEDCGIQGVTITGGVRDPDSRATDAAIVVRRSRLGIAHCRIENNLGNAELLRENIVGIMGICGRENAEIVVSRSHILRNSWDGIALFRDASAKIEFCVVDGVDAARASERGGGRGVAIGVTWNARASIRRNLIRNYWKGIGVFVDAEAAIVYNTLEDLLTWGIAVWDADRGRPRARIVYNLIYNVGACGIAITLPEDSERLEQDCVDNLIAMSGQNERYDDPDHYCTQCPIAIHRAPPDYDFGGNVGWRNRRAVRDSLREQDICPEVGDGEFAGRFRRWAEIPPAGAAYMIGSPLLERVPSRAVAELRDRIGAIEAESDDR